MVVRAFWAAISALKGGAAVDDRSWLEPHPAVLGVVYRSAWTQRRLVTPRSVGDR